MTYKFDVLILGAGAAGLMCAMEAGKRGRRVAVLEHAERAGKKVLISGGGRCNFTNLHCRADNFLSANPHFAKSLLARYTPADFIALIEKHRIAYHEKTLGQLFCDGPAQQVVDMLEQECRAAGVQVFLKTPIREITRPHQFVLRSDGAEFHAPALVVATGGLSIPKMGATSFGYDLARQFGLKIRQPWPGLVPLTFSEEDRAHYCDLAGVSAEVVASIGNQTFREKMLITHRGLSGPAILQISSYWKKPQAVWVDLAPGCNVTSVFRNAKISRTTTALKARLQDVLPSRLAARWLELHGPSGWTNAELAEFEKRIHRWEVHPAGTEGYDKAEVTAGGVDTDELHAKNMESRKVPGLFFVGEVVDVTGWLGGYNFQWAWASGVAAGRGL
ncbi:MAG TPA: NAD(P)/FAD-dependent oxidoreductase [Candidatus Sulfotelmatobacter sp.]|nr:NAD(P)/FAD-dependent oxidoreductase [Candidatus Sulfotelmatobacter sp.]